jgi:hypothetical protein
VLRQLNALHPHEAPPANPTTDTAPLQERLPHLQQVLCNLQKDKAVGPSSWTYEHLPAVAGAGPVATSSLLRLANAMVSGKLPPLPALLDGCLIAISKAVGGGVLPVDMPEIWARFAALCVIAASDNPALKPLQLGVGVSGGSEAMGHTLRQAPDVDADVDRVVVQVDLVNAFQLNLPRGLGHGSVPAASATAPTGDAAVRPALKPVGSDRPPRHPPPVCSLRASTRGTPWGPYSLPSPSRVH